ncbi:transglutaminase-like domain-containing protein [Pelagicoccus albus]|uniref:Transglutaminase-like domain-containing protein n=1 Tax=Pelagicoccus albus TaxID=415222 RepID=A0A7X1B932_9BACT|nr:transglutaminase-like domain-containing protein [Pelagicoccus albus]MBC2607964.1 hypothetical protein [Pelagicoccus albus]
MKRTLRHICSLSAILCLFGSLATASESSSPEGGLAESSLELNKQMIDFLQSSGVSEEQPPVERMQGILDALYGAEDGFTYDSAANFSAQKAFEEKRGNCVSLAMLFTSFARSVGLDARFNQLDYTPIWENVDGILVETIHINVLVYVGGNQYVVDAQPELVELASHSRNPVSDERVFSHFYNNQGLLALADGKLELAGELIQRAIEMDPENGTAWQNRGLYHFRSSNKKEGEESLVKAAELNRSSSSACFQLSAYYEAVGDTNRSEKYAKLGSKRSKRNPFYHYYRSQQFAEQGDLKKATKHLEYALKILPSYSTFQIALMDLKQRQEQDKGLASKPELARFH